jgi:predicted signal transduction protein with EAL and GGDEF domain
MLGKAIAAHPRASLQDALLLVCVMLAALLLGLQYDLFYFIERLSAAQRKISLGETIFLSALLAASLIIFTIRRLRDQRRDIAVKSAAENELRELTALALRDPLTGLLNRRALLSAPDAAMATPPGNGTEHALFMIDLNHFKRVNDVHGHAAGDEILQLIADRFQAASRPSDLVARIGGDALMFFEPEMERKQIA